MIKLYQYPNCSTCKKAIKFLNEKEIEFKNIIITDQPPTKTELKKMLKHYDGEIKKLFNTSGQVYRELKLTQKLPSMSKEECIDLLSKNGKLIKRPFILTGTNGLVGFKEDQWNELV